MIRFADSSDVDALVTLDREPGGNNWSRQQFVSACLGRTSERVLVYCEQLKPVGLLVYQTVLDEAEILNIVVATAARGQGYGRRLLNDVCDILKQQGVKRLFLEVRESNSVAIGLYQTMGFSQIGLRKNYYATKTGREHALLLVLQLS